MALTTAASHSATAGARRQGAAAPPARGDMSGSQDSHSTPAPFRDVVTAALVSLVTHQARNKRVPGRARLLAARKPERRATYPAG
jgi:hypothetical protein